MPIVLIQCTDTKRDEPARAWNLYDESRYFRKMRDYAEAKTDEDSRFILSAKHGLVRPDERLEPYDEFGLSEEQAVEIAEELPEAQVVELVAGKAYCDLLTPELEKRGYDVIEPFRGLKIGQREKQLSIETKKLQYDTLC